MQDGPWETEVSELPELEADKTIVTVPPNLEELAAGIEDGLRPEDLTELEKGWRLRMQWAAGWLLEKGQNGLPGKHCSQPVRHRLGQAGVNQAESFSEEAGRLLLAWGRQEWQAMVLEVGRLQGDTSGEEGGRNDLEWPNREQVARSIAGFMLEKLPGWEQAERWRQWQRQTEQGSV